MALVMLFFMADVTLFMCMAEGSEKPKSEWSVKMTCKGQTRYRILLCGV